MEEASVDHLVALLDQDDFRRELLTDMAWRWNSSPWNASKSPRHR